MKVRVFTTDARTGRSSERWVDRDMDAAAALDAEIARAEHNAAIVAEMNDADMRAIRALLDGDMARIEAHKAAQAERRARLL